MNSLIPSYGSFAAPRLNEWAFRFPTAYAVGYRASAAPRLNEWAFRFPRLTPWATELPPLRGSGVYVDSVPTAYAVGYRAFAAPRLWRLC
jgi:hypothetical protein